MSDRPFLVSTDMASECVDLVMDLADYGGHVLVLQPECVMQIADIAKRIREFNDVGQLIRAGKAEQPNSTKES